ncbi:hypothetical protein [Paenibacillus sp. MMO-58]|uniref:hypothetical protein n=1 Tax=Paenibacillus sp. MMO-58 TaxID=3081290 RepID=UPI0030199C0B
MNSFIEHAVNFVTDKDKVQLVVAYLNLFAVARSVSKKEKASDKKSKAKSKGKMKTKRS